MKTSHFLVLVAAIVVLAAMLTVVTRRKKEVSPLEFPRIEQERIVDESGWLVITKIYRDPVSDLAFADALPHEVYSGKEKFSQHEIAHSGYTFINEKNVKVGDMVKIKWVNVMQAPTRSYSLPVISIVK